MSSIAEIQATIDRLNEESNGSIRRYGFEFDEARIGSFLRHRTGDETLRDLTRLAEWHQGVNQQNHDGVTLTPLLKDFLAEPGGHRGKAGGDSTGFGGNTRMGRFDLRNEIERDLEYHRYNWAYHEVIAPNLDPYENAPYDEFVKLPQLGQQTHEEFVLDGQNLIEARRVAYEAYTLLGFLRKFRAGTSRPIPHHRQRPVRASVGYRAAGGVSQGRFHDSLSACAVAQIDTPYGSEHDLADRRPRGAGPGDDSAAQQGDAARHRGGRAERGAREGQDDDADVEGARGTTPTGSSPSTTSGPRETARSTMCKMPHPDNHFPELKRWFGFVEAQRKMRPWVEPGETYSMTMWAPEITEETVLGDFKVRTREVGYGSDEPQAILANPLIYRTDDDDPDIHENLRGNRPYYYDGPERHVQHELQFGFGDHGLESRVIGNTSDELVEAVQEFMRQEVARLLEEERGNGEDAR